MTDETERPRPKAPYALTHACGNCPFRKDREFYLDPRRAEEIAESLRSDADFSCHKTLDYQDEGPQKTDRTNACAGALKTIINGGREDISRNAPMQIAERLGYFVPDRLDPDMPVYDNLDEWVQSKRDLQDQALGRRAARRDAS